MMAYAKDMLLICFLLSSTIWPSSAAIEWTHGMRLNAFITQATMCPDKLSDAQANSSYSPVFSTNKEIVAGGAQPSNSGALFYITNGFHVNGPWDSTSRTSLMDIEPLATGGGCWNMATEPGSVVEVAKCDNSNNQTFWIEALRAPSPSGPFQIANHKLNKLKIPAQPGRTIGSQAGNSDDGFCFYDTNSKSVISSTNNGASFQRASNITGLVIPKNLTDDVALPGCTTSYEYTPLSMDCIIAKAVTSLPTGCDSNPQQRKCVLYLFPAFCGDLPLKSNTTDGDAAIESCLRGISQGPCVANPGGAACTSNLFPGIAFKTGSSTSSSAAAKRHDLILAVHLDTRQSRDPLFGDAGESHIPLEDQFWIGVAKSMVNQLTGVVHALFKQDQETRHILCVGVSKLSKNFNTELSKRVGDGCQYLWKMAEQGPPTLEYQGIIEQAGGITTDIISILAPIADAAEAAKAVGAVDYMKGLLGRFSPKATTGGTVLEAIGADSQSTVRIFKRTRPGRTAPFETADEGKAVLKDIEENGFTNCEKITTRVTKRASNYEVGCSLLTENYSESESGSDWESEPESPTQKIVHKTAPGLTEEENKLLETLKKTWSDTQTTRQPYMPKFEDATLQSFRERMETTRAGDGRKPIVRDFASQFGLRQSEVAAIQGWHSFYSIKTTYLESAFKKITPNFKGIVRRTTALDDETRNMLVNFESGIISKGQPGIYEIRDLVTNYGGLDFGSAEPPRKLFAASAGISDKTWFGGDKMFIVDSQFGTYTSPAVFDAEELYEIDFLDGVSGKMKLLGYEGMSEDGSTIPNPRIFYFKNIA